MLRVHDCAVLLERWLLGARPAVHRRRPGGLGAPHDRDPAAVACDVAEGAVSAEAAAQVYGKLI